MQPYYGDIPQYNETRSYNARGQMTSLQYTGVLNWGYPTLPNVNLSYTYSPTNNDGRITQMTNAVSGEVVNYQYDSLGRLTLAQTTGTQWGQSFGYDGFGNLTSEVATQGTAFTSYQNYDPTTNRIVGGGTSYDANGNLTAMPTLTLSYDEENRLVQSVQSLNGSEQYVYNPSGQLVYRQNNTATEVYMYGVKGERIRFDLVLPSWYDGNLLLFTYVDQELYFAGKLLEPDDRLGTNLAASSPYGQSASTFPYGELRQAPAAGDRYATYLLDTTSNLNYARNRWYSSQVARFTTVDPYMKSARARSPQSWNRYAYVGGDPINRNDPSGRLYYYSNGDDGADGDDGGDGTVDDPYNIGFTITIPVDGTGDPDPGDPAPDDPTPDDPTPVGPSDNQTTSLSGDGPSQPPKTPSQLQRELTAARQAALTDLTKAPCASALGGGVLGSKNLSALFGALIQNQTAFSALPAGQNAVTTDINGNITITINSQWGSFASGTINDQTTTLLHELGHAIYDELGPGGSSQLQSPKQYAIQPDATSRGISKQNDANVFEDCITPKAP